MQSRQCGIRSGWIVCGPSFRGLLRDGVEHACLLRVCAPDAARIHHSRHGSHRFETVVGRLHGVHHKMLTQCSRPALLTTVTTFGLNGAISGIWVCSDFVCYDSPLSNSLNALESHRNAPSPRHLAHQRFPTNFRVTSRFGIGLRHGTCLMDATTGTVAEGVPVLTGSVEADDNSLAAGVVESGCDAVGLR